VRNGKGEKATRVEQSRVENLLQRLKEIKKKSTGTGGGVRGRYFGFGGALNYGIGGGVQ